jgi:hypothetical protein
MLLREGAREPTVIMTLVCSNICEKQSHYIAVGLHVQVVKKTVFRRSSASSFHGILCIEEERSARPCKRLNRCWKHSKEITVLEKVDHGVVEVFCFKVTANS